MEEASLHTTRKHLFISTQYYVLKLGCLPERDCLSRLCLTRPTNLLSSGNVWRSGTTNCGPSKLCARAQSEDDMPSRTLTCMEYTRWVFYNDIKFLEQQNPPEQSWLRILFSKQVFECRMCNVLEPRYSFACIVYRLEVLGLTLP
ncbi:hypothetical protein Tco_1220726 [Tanacetum coccineum]